MRRVRHLEQCDYVIPLRQKNARVLALSNQSNVYLERTWHQSAHRPIDIYAYAKFNTGTMNGLEILTLLEKNNKSISAILTSAKLYKLDDQGFGETMILNVPMIEAIPGVYLAQLTQAQIGLGNELSGRETYSLEIKFKRVRKTYAKRFWFNHLGCYDSINRLRQTAERLDSVKVDE